jgi:uncharacterized protein (DUF1778 family)
MRVSDKERALIKQIAEFYGMNVSEYIRNAVMEKIEDEFDLLAYEQALQEFESNPITYSLQEVINGYGQ